MIDTAAGRVAARVVPSATIQVGGIRVEGIRVVISDAGTAALLGQNFLNKLDLRQEAHRMILRADTQSQ